MEITLGLGAIAALIALAVVGWISRDDLFERNIIVEDLLAALVAIGGALMLGWVFVAAVILTYADYRFFGGKIVDFVVWRNE